MSSGYSPAPGLGETPVCIVPPTDGQIVVYNATSGEAEWWDASAAHVIKRKKLTGTTGATEGDITNIAHGLPDISKIIGMQVLVTQSTEGNRVPPAFTIVAEHEYDVFILITNVRVVLTATNSGSMLNGAITVLLTYEE